MTELTGWLFDLYPDAQRGLVLWLLGDDGQRHRLTQAFPITFYASGPAWRLRQLWRFLQAQPVPVELGRTERRELFKPELLPVLTVTVPGEAATEESAAPSASQPQLFKRVQQAFPDLNYYDADLALSLRHAARFGTFPLVRCQMSVDERDQVQAITPLDTPWELDPETPPLRVMSLELDCDPAHATPKAVVVHTGVGRATGGGDSGRRYTYRFPLQPARALLVNLQALLQRHDPDLLLTTCGDTWLLPRLLALAEECSIPLALNRDPDQPPVVRAEHSYFSYGQIVYCGQQLHLRGRWHIDRANALLHDDFGLVGILEFARVTGLPVQEAARVSPGTGISAMQIVTALRQEILVPWCKGQPETPKSALELIQRDQGGLIYRPLIGLYANVGEVDFVSMYPSLMVRFNISPETAGGEGERDLIRGRATHLEPFTGGTCYSAEAPDKPLGLVPLTLAPLLEKRLALKARLGQRPRWDPRRQADQARASAHKWLLVTCFGYLGYKNARFGRIEAHEAVTAFSREALLRAKEAAEELGGNVLHLYVDGMWILHSQWCVPKDFQPLLEAIAERTGLSIGLDGIFRWVVFLPSRLDERVPVANRYFGVFQDGTIKVRGIEARRRDTPPWLAKLQMEMLEELAQAPSVEALPDYLPRAVQQVRRALSDLRAGRVPLEDLLVGQKLSRALEAYRTPSPAARAALQLQMAGKTTQPGQRVRFLFTRGEPGVHAWSLPEPPNPATVDTERYRTLLLRAAETILQPLGLKTAKLHSLMLANACYPGEPCLPLVNLSAKKGLWTWIVADKAQAFPSKQDERHFCNEQYQAGSP